MLQVYKYITFSESQLISEVMCVCVCVCVCVVGEGRGGGHLIGTGTSRVIKI